MGSGIETAWGETECGQQLEKWNRDINWGNGIETAIGKWNRDSMGETECGQQLEKWNRDSNWGNGIETAIGEVE